MKDRIKMIMDTEKMTAAQFADSLKIGRAVMSHVLNGRNKPSLEVVTRVLSEFPYINSDWLLTGKGNMYTDKSDIKNETDYESEVITEYTGSLQPDLFSQNTVNPPIRKDSPEYRKESGLKSPQNNSSNTGNERIVYRERPSKKISKIIIYYTDNTYEIFDPQK